MTNFVRKYTWKSDRGAPRQEGYMITGTNNHWTWLNRADAWDAANELADLLTEDIKNLENNQNQETE